MMRVLSVFLLFGTTTIFQWKGDFGREQERLGGSSSFVSSFVVPLGLRSPDLRFQDYHRGFSQYSKNAIGKLTASTSAIDTNSTLEETTPVIRKQDDGRSDEIIDTIADYYSNSIEEERLRGNIQLVAGSGKTYVAWRVMERLLLLEERSKTTKHTPACRPKIGLFVTPFLNLIDQALTNREEHGIMEAFDTETLIVASRTSRKREASTTKPTEIYNFLSSQEKKADAKILVCTYNSLPRVGAALRMWQEEEDNLPSGIIDFAVFDEAHKMEGLNRGDDQTTNSGFVYGLYDSNIDIRNRLFMSGTPHNYTEDAKVIECLPTRPKTDGARKYTPFQTIENNTINNDDNWESPKGYDDENLPIEGQPAPRIRSFANEDIFGPCLAQKTHRESVEENITLPISLYGVETSILEEYGTTGREPPPGYGKDYFLPMAIRSAFHKLPIRHAVSFHSTNQRAMDFLYLAEDILQDESPENSITGTPISLFHMNGYMPPTERNEILKMAREAPRSLITNCRVLSTGVDEASLDMVVMADPVQSSTDGRQMIGRVGRKAPGKERGYVLIPLPVDDVDLDTEYTTIEDNSHPYRLFVSIFQNMVALDPELRQDVLLVIAKSNDLNRTLVQSEYPERLREAFIFDSNVSLDLQYRLMDLAIVEYASSKGREAQWNAMFALLTQYKEREGDCNVPFVYQEDGKNLGTWLMNQRTNKKKGTLSGDYEVRLTSLGVVWDVLAQQWEDMFALLVQYKEREGDCNVPKGHQEDGENLGNWLNAQRQNKKKRALDGDLEERLTNLGVVWDVLAQQWNAMFALLTQYKAREGDCNVPRRHQEDGENLGIWLNTQRRNKKEGNLDGDVEARLTNIGMVWDVYAQQWEDTFALLVKYKEREGDCNVPREHKEDGENLGNWLMNQRQNKKKGVLDGDLEERLTSLGVVWDQNAQQWEDTFALLVQYKEREGDCNVPREHKEDGENLGTWLKTQRRSKKRGVLDNDYEERLTSIGVVWDVYAQQWEDMFALLTQYNSREGDCNVPHLHKEDGENLGIWLNTQRQNKKKCNLDGDLEERLTSLGVVWDPYAQQWEDMFALLVKYKEREGDCNVPRGHKEDGENLGTWLRWQRQNKKKGVLDSDLESRLTSLGVVWDVFAQQWEHTFALLVKYKEREGDCNVPRRHQEDGENLGIWLQDQRQNKKKCNLDGDLEERLTSLGVVWDPYAQQWEDMFALLTQYKAREGDCNVPRKHQEDGENLGIWLGTQRQNKKKGVLDNDYEERLTNLGVVWNVLAQKWEDMFSLLTQYKDREGDCNVPKNHKEDGENLGSWLRNQCQNKKKGKLRAEWENKLSALGVVWELR